MTQSQLPWSHAWITGAGKGIGRAVALSLCQQGVNVYASSRTEADLIELSAACENMAGKIIALPLDITQPDQVASLVSRFGDDLLVPEMTLLNAGTHYPTPVFSSTAEQVSKLMNVNFQGTINCLMPMVNCLKTSQKDQPTPRSAPAQVAIVASVAGYCGLKTAAAYGASKAALINFSEAIKPELDEANIKLQIVNPGFVKTPLTDKNDFEMPYLVEPEDAAAAIIQGLQSDRFEISFPRAFVLQLKLLKLLPYRLLFPLLKRVTQ